MIGDIINIDVPPLLLPGVGGLRDPLRDYRTAVVKQLVDVTEHKNVLLVAEPALAGVRPASAVAPPSGGLSWTDKNVYLRASWSTLYGMLGIDLSSRAVADIAAHLPPTESANSGEGVMLPRSLGAETLRYLLAAATEQHHSSQGSDLTQGAARAAMVSTCIGPPRAYMPLPTPTVVLIARHTLSAHADGLAPTTEQYEHDIHDWLSTLDRDTWRVTTMVAPLPAGMAHA